MYNDESSHSSQGQGQGQGAFVRRPIPKYSGDKSGGEYQQQNQGGAASGGGYRREYGGGYGDRQRDGERPSYSGSIQRDRRPDGGRPGGYGGGSYGGGSGGYRSGGSYGYNRNSNYGSNDRLVKQNDIIIQLLKDIRDRLPAPPGGVVPERTQDSYGSDHSYSSHQTPYQGSAGGDDSSEFDVSGGNADNAVQTSEPDGGTDRDDGEFNN